MANYTTAKIDWAVPDIVQTTDMNEIGNNLQVARMGGGETSFPSYAAANDLDLDLVHNTFEITGTSTIINRIQYYDGVSVNREYGNIITLVFTGTSGIVINCNGATNGANHFGIIAGSSVNNILINQYDCVQFMLADISSTPRWVAINIPLTIS